MLKSGQAEFGTPQPQTRRRPPWLLTAKISIPVQVRDYVERKSLMQAVGSVLDRPVTALLAAAGFGKTALLTDLVRRAAAEDASVAWLTLDAQDDPLTFAQYVDFAFERAGLGVDMHDIHDAWSASTVMHRLGLLLRAVEHARSPYVLVLDEVEKVPPPTVELVNQMLGRVPKNLHVALGLRSNPGLDLATEVLRGTMSVVGADEFRFSRYDISRLFGSRLSRRELDRAEAFTVGWPVAVKLCHNQWSRTGTLGRLGRNDELSASFLGSRLINGLSATDRAHLLDVSVFDWIDAGIVREVLGSGAPFERVTALPALRGLVHRVDSAEEARRVHPLVRDYCRDRLAEADGQRKRHLHATIARALLRRGRFPDACLHASNAEDPTLLNEIVESVGVFGLWLRGGVALLVSTDRLSNWAVEGCPGLALLRCSVLRFSGRIHEANALFNSLERAFDEKAREAGLGLGIDRVFTRIVLDGGVCRLHAASLDGMSPNEAGQRESRDDRLEAAWRLLACTAAHECSRLADSRRHGLEALARLPAYAQYGRVYADIFVGMTAMAQGDVNEAADRYSRARGIAQREFSTDACLSVVTDVLVMELDLECNRVKAVEQRTLRDAASLRGAWIDVHQAALAVATELMSMRSGPQAALELVGNAFDEARALRLGADYQRFVVALKIDALVERGAMDRAARLWREPELAEPMPGILDFDSQSWRTVEALASARVRLLAAQGELGEAARLADRLHDVAGERRLVRTAMRARALSLAVAYQAGAAPDGTRLLCDFLALARHTGYFRPLVRCRAAAVELLGDFLRTAAENDLRAEAAVALEQLGERPRVPTTEFTQREMDVLSELATGRRNKEIATRLGISDEGVRFHLKNIYRKLGVSKRAEAVRRVREIREGS